MIKANLTEGSVLKKLIVFAVPFLLGNVFQAIYSTVDLLIVSWYSTDAAVAAVTVGAQVMQLVVFMLVGFSIGITVLAALYTGAGDTVKTGKAAGTAISVFMVLSIIATVLLYFLTPVITRLMNVEAAAQKEANEYLSVSFLGVIFIVIYNIIAGLYRGAGSTRPALVFVAVSGVLNLFLDIYFVKDLSMGAKGAALATVISQGACCLAAAVLLFIQRKKYCLNIKCFKPDMQELKKMVKLGLPSATQQFVIQISFLVLMGLVSSCGIIYNVAYGYATKISSFAVMPYAAIMSAVSALTGQNLGAGKPERAVKSIRAGLIVAAPLALLLFAAINIFPRAIYSIFTSDAAVLDLTVSFSLYLSFEYLSVFVIYILHGFTNGAGKTMFTMLNSFISSLAARIPLAYLLFHFLGFNGIGLAISLSPIFSSIVAIFYISSGKWKKRSISLSL